MTIKNLQPWGKKWNSSPWKIKNIIFSLLEKLTKNTRLQLYKIATTQQIDFSDYDQTIKFIEDYYFDPKNEVKIRNESFFKKK